MQHEFVSAAAKRCRQLDIHTAIETCGYNKWENVNKVLEHIDEIFFDIKHMDSEKHKALTGVGNELILDNARKAAGLGKKITFRLPLVPGCNSDEEIVIATAEFIGGIT